MAVIEEDLRRPLLELERVGMESSRVDVDVGLEAVFVARFDVHKGNVIEWSHPLSEQSRAEGQEGGGKILDLGGLEFKVLVSGSHLVEEDYVLFQFHGLYGVAVYNQLKEPTAPRGAWQRAAGVLCRHYYYLPQHLSVLSKAAKGVNSNPGVYDTLMEYFMANTSMDRSLVLSPHSLPPVHPEALSPKQATMYLQQVAMACESINCLAEYFGPDIFRLWRALLCGARVLFMSPLPTGAACSRMHAACGLLTTKEQHYNLIEHPSRLYYVNIADIPFLKDVKYYIACTTEKVFADKTQLWDLLIDEKKFIVGKQHTKLLAKMSKDAEMFKDLQSKSGEGPAAALKYFETLNTKLFQRLMTREDMSSGEVKSLGLNMHTAVALLQDSSKPFQASISKGGTCC
eukprot:TRINITY_DN17789_c0_g1_i1.p1 TRINITY_DN17789_c0_g1~~TRINITY_DN17789_c0_g1_i1.p1  ORF type:complete len:400 (+),score=81.18 TRINITY_DN17789_c0_g1_i1:40-1239(+)